MTELEKALKAAKHPVALTGAGISAPSGIPTFSMEWKGRPVREFLTRQYFNENPLEFYELFREMVSWREKHPNYAHKALAHYNVSVVTQNIDGLHQKAGSTKVIELHGNCERLICRPCGRSFKSTRVLSNRPLETIVHCRKCGALLDTDIVLYGDDVRDWWQAFEEVAKADLLLIIGTSLFTAPANQLPAMAERNGCQIIYINDDCLEAFRFYNESRLETFSVKYTEGLGIDVRVSEKLQERIQLWLTNHGCTAKITGAIGGGHSFTVTPTSIGTLLSVRCQCGESLLIYPDDPWDF